MFVGGTGRSGTTLTSEVLAAAPQVLGISESRFLIEDNGIRAFEDKQVPEFEFRYHLKTFWREKILRAIHKLQNIPGMYAQASPQVFEGLWQKALARATNRRQVGRLFVDGLFSMIAEMAGKSIWAETTPRNVSYFHRFAIEWPDAAFIHCIRDPADVVSSLLKQWWGPDTVEDCVFYYNWSMGNARKSKDSIEGLAQQHDCVYVTICVEDLALEPRRTISRISSRIGLDLSASDLDLMAKIPSEEMAHIGRAKREFTSDELELIETGTRDNYDFWKSLADQEKETV
ncbi:MAG: sulfotransferase [Verrucomicrobiia bacterium]